MDGVGVGDRFDEGFKLLNTVTEGRKVYLQFHKYSYDEEMDSSHDHYWTTVYDTDTNSYLPYRRDTYFRDDDGWRKYNTTYTPTQFDWFKLPDRCNAS